ncbi:class I SAM-dependent methyltransferase [Paracoccus sp. (in: a-proteobacteria)]|uniref:class I SAM-dependent methyltransferase n=1 Tax=Paracoccus sp. TaxID=267 RepID=UPI0026E0CE54|nr:methyltransferase [Paracoccus sp. (in: a-proteobacteria)]MDO5370245.1 methyltransferase [Paracoccus sp. (in: a-proteobacteria)]
MAGSRLELIDPIEGSVLLIGAGPGDLAGFDPARTVVVQGFRPAHDSVASQGFRALTSVDGRADAAVVFLPRARAEARARVAAAAAALDEGAALWIDGQKTDGVDAMLRELRGLAPVDQVQSRAHGKIFRVTVPGGDWLPPDWKGARRTVEGGFVTAPGVFSADGPDPASVALAACLPERLPTRMVDLGAGWGWLSAQVLTRPGIELLHLVEADHAALDCAKANVTDPHARFHWADATTFRLPEPVNGVVMNPPFHQGRAADPHLGGRFIRAAAGLLTGAGRLWMVANRHLPYEAALNEHFADVREIGGDNRFKVIAATGAGRPKRRQLSSG